MTKRVVLKKWSLAFHLLYYWGKIVGLNTLVLLPSGELSFSYFSFLYASILVTSYSYVFYRVLMQRMQLQLPAETPVSIIVHFLAIISNFLENILTWIIFAFYQNRIKLIVKSFVKIEKTAKKLGIVTNYEKSFRKLAINAVIITVAYILYATLVILPVVSSSNFHIATWTCWILSHTMAHYTWMIFIWTLRNVEQKSKSLNEKVRFLKRDNYAKRRNVRFQVSAESSISIGNSRVDSLPLLDRIKLIFQLHRELRNVTYHIEKHFDKFILMELITKFSSLTLSIYLIYSWLKRRKTEITEFMYVTALFCWLLIPVVTLTLISNACTSIFDEANETGNILHTILSSCDNFADTEEETAKINVVILDLLHNKLKISVLGFFNLDGSLVYNIIIAATMYLTVMMQF